MLLTYITLLVQRECNANIIFRKILTNQIKPKYVYKYALKKFCVNLFKKLKKKSVAHAGVEPATFALLARHSNQLS